MADASEVITGGRGSIKENKISEADNAFAAMASTASSTMMGFAVTVITLIITFIGKEAEIFDLNVLLLIYVLAIIFFILATEFFALSVSDKENSSKWGLYGSIAYGVGSSWVIVGVCLTFDILIPPIAV